MKAPEELAATDGPAGGASPAAPESASGSKVSAVVGGAGGGVPGDGERQSESTAESEPLEEARAFQMVNTSPVEAVSTLLQEILSLVRKKCMDKGGA